MRAHLTALLFACGFALAAAAPAAANTYYAAPSGAGTTCSDVAPCSALYALATKASLDGDTVVLAGGDYNVSSAIQAMKSISVEGATSGAPTRLIGAPGVQFTLFVSGGVVGTPTHVTDLIVTNQADLGRALWVNGTSTAGTTVDRVQSSASGANAWALTASAVTTGTPMTVRDSIGRATNTNGYGIMVNGPAAGSASIDVRNVVGDARGSGGIGIMVSGGGIVPPLCGNLAVTIKNSIARAALASNDLGFTYGTGGPPCTYSLATSNSNWRNTTSPLAITSTNDQHTVDPVFVDAANGDYHEAGGSPTIDAGTADSANGPLDLDRHARAIGPAADIGAYEFSDVVAPKITGFKLSPNKFRPKAPKVPSIAKTGKGATVTLQLSEAAALKFTVERASSGHKKGKKCSSKAKKGKKCTLYKAVKGSFSGAGAAGANSFKFTGYVNGKRLPPGTYRLAVAATDLYGNAAAKSYAGFKIVR